MNFYQQHFLILVLFFRSLKYCINSTEFEFTNFMLLQASLKSTGPQNIGEALKKGSAACNTGTYATLKM
jgi:hypothetical protein